ncbi:MAG: DUF4982 domain-containing protein [Clostridia bacterium]|nr:DUF4982 domain-containing protein [Clostridia bacterium]
MREKILFDYGWLFHRGDIKMPLPETKGIMYTSAKTERVHMGPAAVGYFAAADSYDNKLAHNPERWQAVTLPHDYVIDGVPDEHGNNALGFLKYDNAWYRKKFTVPESDLGRRITLLFEGVATHATVYLNGCLMKHNFCGYTTFEVDITDTLLYGEENVLAVYVNTEEHEGWWYEGGGIYRHVYLCKTDSTALDLWGIYVMPEKIGDDTWRLTVENTVRRDDKEERTVRTLTEISDGEGAIIATLEASGKVEPYGKVLLKSSCEVKAPHLWSLEDPYLYYCTTKVFVNDPVSGTEIQSDADKVHFGFRYVDIDPEKGLFVNGKHTVIKGVCGHADCGLTGKAVPDNIHREKVHMMKEMGANAYRTSHYPQAEALMDAFDELGMLVMDETRWFESTDEGLEQLTMLMKRDRNRPSVIFWSIGNEEPLFVTEQGRRICRRMMAHARKLDNSRVIMTANDKSPDKATVYDENDVIGINYNLHMYESVHEKYPNKAVFSSECCATGTTRGWYYPSDHTHGYLSAYDADTNNWFLGREKTWKFLRSHEWIMGGFQWIAFEHRGEAVWPRLCSQSGAIDLFMQKKDAFWQNKSLWTTEPMVHLFPHWNFCGREGELIRVSAYTNCDSVEFFLNGKSLGTRKVEQFGHAEWQVEYVSGIIEVKAYRDGKFVASDKRETSGAAYRLALRLENKEELCAGGRDLALVTCYVLDKEGREVPDASPFVRFTTDGNGKIHSTGSDICDHTNLLLPDRRMRAGRITAAVCTGNDKGEMRVYAEADSLLTASIAIKIK